VTTSTIVPRVVVREMLRILLAMFTPAENGANDAKIALLTIHQQRYPNEFSDAVKAYSEKLSNDGDRARFESRVLNINVVRIRS
jgi:hypothetical protein